MKAASVIIVAAYAVFCVQFTKADAEPSTDRNSNQKLAWNSDTSRGQQFLIQEQQHGKLFQQLLSRTDALHLNTKRFNDFKNQQLNDFVNRTFIANNMLSETMMRSMSYDCVLQHTRGMFRNYNQTLQLLDEQSSSCVTDDMKAYPEKAVSQILSCLPDAEAMNKNLESAKTNFDDFLAQLETLDKTLSGMTDNVEKQIKVTDAEWNVLYQFFANQAEDMYKDIQSTCSCLTSQRSDVKQHVSKYTAQIEKCYRQ